MRCASSLIRTREAASRAWRACSSAVAAASTSSASATAEPSQAGRCVAEAKPFPLAQASFRGKRSATSAALLGSRFQHIEVLASLPWLCFQLRAYVLLLRLTRQQQKGTIDGIHSDSREASMVLSTLVAALSCMLSRAKGLVSHMLPSDVDETLEYQEATVDETCVDPVILLHTIYVSLCLRIFYSYILHIFIF